jgi:xanthine dehydrogenase accessory factor
MDVHEKIIELKKENRSFVVVTVVKVTGSTPGKTGFKMIVENDGKISGTVGGGAIENEAINEAKRMMASNSDNDLKEYLLSKDENVSKPDLKVLPMSCSGKVWLFYEAEKKLPVVYIFGGGHVGQALIDLLKNLNYHIILIDNRQEMFEKNKAKGTYCIYSDYIEYSKQFIPSENSFFVIVTYGHQFDYEIIKTLYERNLVNQYAGIIASKSKATEIISNLKKEINSEIDLSKLHTPIGLKIGGNSAHEIALSIAAEIQTVRYGKNVLK